MTNEDQPSPAAPSWVLVQLSELLRRIELANDRALTVVYRADDGLDEVSSLTVRAEQLADVDAEVHEIAQLALRAEQLAEALPRADVTVTYGEVATDAAQEISEGTMLDVDRVLLAARLLDAEPGLRAFVTCFRQSDVHTAWEGTSIADILGSLRGVTPEVVRAIAASAGLSPDDEIAACEPDEIAALASAIEAHLNR
jgi:hypothetical protein